MDFARNITVDNHMILRKGLATILNVIDYVKVVGEDSNGNELLELLKR
jgi:DNA-binding NarL/FixJ family response regulator